LQQILARSVNRIATLKAKLGFDAIAFSGSSGCAIAFHVAATLGIPLMYVRKANEQSHSYQKVDCNFARGEIKKYLIVDDFVQSGDTIRHITNTIAAVCEKQGSYPAKPVGIFCYDKCQGKTRGNDNRVNIAQSDRRPKYLRIYINE
jgi:orotate phosphoribosyltransferase-like protein